MPELDAPQFFALLCEAVEPLQRAFGDEIRLYLRDLSCAEDCLWKAVIEIPPDFQGDPEAALRSFDEDWWLANCHRSDGGLVFDYERT